MDFLSNLLYGQTAEQDLGDIIAAKGNIVNSTKEKGKFSDYDLEVINPDNNNRLLLEVKCDTQAINTGNIAVEIGKIVNGEALPSGLSATKADYFVYKMNAIPGFWAIEVETLKVLVETEAKFTCQGGDNMSSTLVLIDRKLYQKHATELLNYFK